MTIDGPQQRIAALFYREFLRARGLEPPAEIDGWEIGDRVVVIRDVDCPEYVGRTGTVVELRPWAGYRIGDPNPRTIIVALDNDADGGYPDGFDAGQLAPHTDDVASAAA